MQADSWTSIVLSIVTMLNSMVSAWLVRQVKPRTPVSKD